MVNQRVEGWQLPQCKLCTQNIINNIHPRNINYFFPMAQQPLVIEPPPPLSKLLRSQTLHTGLEPSGRVIRPTRRPLPDNTQHSQGTDRHASGGIWTRNHSKRVAADADHYHQPQVNIFICKFHACVIMHGNTRLGRVWTGLIWLRIETSCWVLYTR